MKILIYASGILGVILLVVGLICLFAELAHNTLFVVSSMVLLGLVFIPLNIVDKHRQNKKVNDIIKSYKNNNKKGQTIERGQASTKGWGMNNSPFRERKSGLDWGRGNIKGANAIRGSRKSFLK